MYDSILSGVVRVGWSDQENFVSKEEVWRNCSLASSLPQHCAKRSGEQIIETPLLNSAEVKEPKMEPLGISNGGRK